MSIKIEVGDTFEVALTVTKRIPVGMKMKVTAVNSTRWGDLYTLDAGYIVTTINKHPMIDGIGVVLKKCEESICEQD